MTINNSVEPVNEVSDDMQGNPRSQGIPDVNTDRASGNEHTTTDDSCHGHDPEKKCKPGIKLPNTPSQRKEANAYSHQAFFQELSAGIEDLDDFVRTTQDRVYDYFASTCGVTQEMSQSQSSDKYNNLSINALKSILNQLKVQKADLDEIKYLSKLIRNKLRNHLSESVPEGIENKLRESFWKTCRDIFNKASNSLPTFSIAECTQYFRSTLTGQAFNSGFKIPSWIPSYLNRKLRTMTTSHRHIRRLPEQSKRRKHRHSGLCLISSRSSFSNVAPYCVLFYTKWVLNADSKADPGVLEARSIDSHSREGRSRRHVQLSTHNPSIELVQDHGISHQEQDLRFPCSKQLYRQNHSKGVLADGEWCHGTHRAINIRLLGCETAHQECRGDLARPSQCLRWGSSWPHPVCHGIPSPALVISGTFDAIYTDSFVKIAVNSDGSRILWWGGINDKKLEPSLHWGEEFEEGVSPPHYWVGSVEGCNDFNVCVCMGLRSDCGVPCIIRCAG